MAKAYMKISNNKDLYLQDTRVENLFIAEFLPAAPEGFVKVYLFGLMYAQNGMSLDTAKLSRVLGIPENEITKAWSYWEEKGLINLQYNEDFSEYSIEYLSQVSSIYGKHAKTSAPEVAASTDDEEDDVISKLVDQEIKAIRLRYEELTGRLVSSAEVWRIGDAIKTYDILPDVMSYAVDYIAETDHPSVNSVIRTAVKWTQEGCRNLAEVKEYLDAHSKREQYYALVFREMGWNRFPNPGDREIMDRWFDELGCSITEVLAACRASSGLRDPSLKYVNKVIENRKLEAGGINTREASKPSAIGYGLGGYPASDNKPEGSKAMVSKKVLREYYDYIRQEADRELDARIDEACSRIIELRDVFELENKLNHELMSSTLAFDNKEQKQMLRDQRKALEEDKRRYLRENGYSEDFLDKKYRCNVCKDTGLTDDGRICTCSEARAQEAYKWNQERKQ